jgi:hypothetical protein
VDEPEAEPDKPADDPLPLPAEPELPVPAEPLPLIPAEPVLPAEPLPVAPAEVPEELPAVPLAEVPVPVLPLCAAVFSLGWPVALSMQCVADETLDGVAPGDVEDEGDDDD